MNAHVTDSPPPDEVVLGGDGSCWRKAGCSPSGEQLYVLDGVDPETCLRWVKVPEAELIELVGGLTPVQAASGATTEVAQ